MTTETYTTMKLSEEQIKTLVRNALMVAGQEMGEEGDHWPVIKNTITDIMRDWEELEIERNVHAEVKKHLVAQLERVKEIVASCTPEVQAKVAPRFRELEDLYNAYFEETGQDIIYLADNEDDELPPHLQRAKAIIGTLEEEK